MKFIIKKTFLLSFLFLYFSDGYFEYSGNSLKEGETTHTYLDIEVPGNKTLTSKTITLFDVFGKFFRFFLPVPFASRG